MQLKQLLKDAIMVNKLTFKNLKKISQRQQAEQLTRMERAMNTRTLKEISNGSNQNLFMWV